MPCAAMSHHPPLTTHHLVIIVFAPNIAVVPLSASMLVYALSGELSAAGAAPSGDRCESGSVQHAGYHERCGCAATLCQGHRSGAAGRDRMALGGSAGDLEDSRAEHEEPQVERGFYAVADCLPTNRAGRTCVFCE